MYKLLQDSFYDCARKYPHNAAIVDEHGCVTSYQQLSDASVRLMELLLRISCDTPSGRTFIGILSHVNAPAVAAVLGILESRKTYVPLDTLYSDSQLAKVIKTTGLEIVVVDRSLLKKFHKPLLECGLQAIITFDTDLIFEVQDAKHQSSTPCRTIKHQVANATKSSRFPSDDLAYILHTSGSTGEPKGIMLSHRNATTFVDWMSAEFQITESDRVMSRAPLKFDLSVFDIFNTLSVGATLICYDWNSEREGDVKHTEYVRLLEREHATILYTTPSTLITLREKGNLFSSSNHLRTIMYAGEPFPVAKLAEIMLAAPNTKVANIYGPTETNIVTYHWVTHDDLKNNVIPLGRTVDDTEIIVVSEDGKRECEPNEIGELWCRGGTVTPGYLNRPDLTSSCQADSPFHPYPAKYWKTGDYGYRDEHGLLYYRGRKDHMYKVNGYRVETGEIEEALAKVPSFYESCITIEDRGGKKQIVCHYSLKTNMAFDIRAATNILRSELQSFKIPSAFIEYDELPKTSSGKIDRMRLQE
ncbi:hypothetical protein C7H84_33445 [Burkholderia sp. Nafp2/4-1b]|uniref:amino acid adenylation domain-containing protein n=1 Tax=Burkholderia sp. Nafp2/4-1b TaxID=2116686 RepID=UPI000EF8B338|nr:amino acid adenylation domain-containing protein [Burkholderia sp. Nafp2/4-1b]RKT99071.1 hypothetical protein C7H84_33445 [Burkholderia sp. Nafp2/4-1b]